MPDTPVQEPKRVLLSWSSGKDSAWTLYQLQQDPSVSLVGLFSTMNGAFDRVAMHATRRRLLKAQADAAGLPLFTTDLPWPCSDAKYQDVMHKTLKKLQRKTEFTHLAFGDLFLEDVRDYRIKLLANRPITPLFPLWGQDTHSLAANMIAAGLKARLTCLNPQQLDPALAGAEFDHAFLDTLPYTVDPCGERGEFHTFAYAGPMFSQPIPIEAGEVVERDGFVFADLK